jgi:anti-sigma B factor antagonist
VVSGVRVWIAVGVGLDDRFPDPCTTRVVETLVDPARQRPAGVASMTDTANNQPLRIRRDVSAEGTVVHIMGEVDLVTAPQLEAELRSLAEQTPRPETTVVNLTDVGFLASAGLNVLVYHSQRYRERGLELCVVAGNRTVSRVINLMGLADVLAVRNSVAAALAPDGTAER